MIEYNLPSFVAFFSGKFEPSFCPSQSGCRSVVSFEDQIDPELIDIVGNISISFNNTAGKPIWIVSIYNTHTASKPIRIMNINNTHCPQSHKDH